MSLSLIGAKMSLSLIFHDLEQKCRLAIGAKKFTEQNFTFMIFILRAKHLYIHSYVNIPEDLRVGVRIQV